MRPLLPSFTLGLTLALAAGAAATPFFYRDDFNGTSLDPGWEVNPGGFEGSGLMTYEVSGGYFRPTGWVTGNNPSLTRGTALLSRQLLPFGQFIGSQNSGFHVTMGFRPPVWPTHGRLDILIGARNQWGDDMARTGRFGLFHSVDAGNTYRFSMSVPEQPSLQSQIVTLDPTLDHTLEIIGENGVVSMLINGQSVLSSAYTPTWINRMGVGFSGSVGTGQSNLIDYIQIVPEPVSAVVFGAAGAALLARKMKRQARSRAASRKRDGVGAMSARAVDRS